MTRFLIAAAPAVCVLAATLASCSSAQPEPARNGDPFYLANPTHGGYGTSDQDIPGMRPGMGSRSGTGMPSRGGVGGARDGSIPSDPSGSSGSMSFGSGGGTN